jgi:hypothetical protein
LNSGAQNSDKIRVNIQVILWVLICNLFFLNSTWADESMSSVYVTRFAMQTVKSKNFKELAENLFQDPFERKEVLVFLKKNSLLKRALPDLMAEDSKIIIKERKKSIVLDFSQMGDFKLFLDKELVPYTGRESFADLYHTLCKMQKPQQAGGKWSWVLPEASAALAVLANVALAQYGKAAMGIQVASQSCPQNPQACSTLAQSLVVETKNLAFKTCDSKNGNITFTAQEFFKGRARRLNYALELQPSSEPTYASKIKVEANRYNCVFSLKTDGEGFGTDYGFDCESGQDKLAPKDLEPKELKLITGKKYSDLIKCCGHPACAEKLLASSLKKSGRKPSSIKKPRRLRVKR